MIKKEIWIRVEDSNEFDAVRKFIWGIIERFSGDCEIISYAEKQKDIKKLPKSYCLNMDCTPLLIAKYGEENIKITERKEYPTEEKAYKRSTQETLERIADAMESINDNLDRLNENIEGVTGSFQNRSFFNVVASVHEN